MECYFCTDSNIRMKKVIPLLLLLILCLGCKREYKLTFEDSQVNHKACPHCPEIKIAVPHALDDTQVAMAINRSISEELIYTLKFEGAEDVSSIEEAMQSFTSSYQDLQQKFGDEATAWEAEIDGEVRYEDKNFITIQLNSYVYTGGAHGYGSTTFLNFEKEAGNELDNPQLFSNYEGFEALAQQLFREKEGIHSEQNINATGFMFNGDQFHLSENIGYTEAGIQLLYNQYEVASYADGPIMLTIPFEKANPYLKFKVAP